MDEAATAQHTSFAGSRLIGTGALSDVASLQRQRSTAASRPLSSSSMTPAEWSTWTSEARRATSWHVSRRSATRSDRTARSSRKTTRRPIATPQTPRGRGRPKLGVVAREVTLLPRHWDWLATQPGGAFGRGDAASSTALGRRMPKRTGAAPRRSRHTGSCRRWPATRRASRRPLGRCSRTTGAVRRDDGWLARRRPQSCSSASGRCWQSPAVLRTD
jgi:hypothetical protein